MYIYKVKQKQLKTKTMEATKIIKLEILESYEVKLESYEFKSHTLGELLKARDLRNNAGEVIEILNVTRSFGRDKLTIWEKNYAILDLTGLLKKI